MEERATADGARPLSGRCFSQRAVTDVEVAEREQKREENVLTVCKREDAARQERGSRRPSASGARVAPTS